MLRIVNALIDHGPARIAHAAHSTTMTAAVRRAYGSTDVLSLERVERPTPGPDDVLVRVHAVSLNAADHLLLHGRPWPIRLVYGLFRPKIEVLGADIAGRVEAVGRNITDLAPGDEVFGDLNWCGFGGLAEYVCARRDCVTRTPASVRFIDAAAAPLAGITALQGLRDAGQIEAGQSVLINGASGGVGTFAVMLAKHFGAEVTGVCSTSKVDQTRALGADHVIDYTTEDFVDGGPRYDLIFDVATNRRVRDHLRCLRPGGRYVAAGGRIACLLEAALWGPILSRLTGKTVSLAVHRHRPDDLSTIAQLLAGGQLTPVIDRRYPLEQIADGLDYLGQGHARGKVVITL